MESGELVSTVPLARWRQRGFIRFIPLRGDIRRARAEELASLPIGVFTAFAPLREDRDVVRVERVRSIY